MKLDIHRLSSFYQVKYLTEEDCKACYTVYKSNPLYFSHIHEQPSLESVLEDMKALPPHKTMEDKYFVGFYKDKQLVAIMDLIAGFPDEKTAFIGLFIVHKAFQGSGIGSKIITEVLMYLENYFMYVRLGRVKGNPESKAFWHKQGFHEIGRENQTNAYTVVLMQKTLFKIC